MLLNVDFVSLMGYSTCLRSLSDESQTALFPLYSLHKHLSSKYESRHIIKCVDDVVIVSLLEGEELDHGPAVDEFVSWCKESFVENQGHDD